MRKFFLAYFMILTVSIAGFGQENAAQEDYIPWGVKLKWADFQGEIPKNSKFDALTHSAISLNFEGANVTLNFDIETIFSPVDSWKKVGVDDYILNHEQVHFDITEYHTRLLRKRLKAHKFKNFASVEPDIMRIFNEASSAANAMQVKYDDETDHSINRKKQAKWNKKIKKLLSKTSTYKKASFKVSISYITS
ncbi:MAG: hypothetical protein ACI857_000870 [Arenicella sp.]|jgi:hypothetical protein